MAAREHVVELLELEIAIYRALIDLLLDGKIAVVSAVAGTDGSRPDDYIFKVTGREGHRPQAPDTLDELVRLRNKA